MSQQQTPPQTDPAALKERIGPYGVWLGSTLFAAPAATLRRAAAEIEDLGLGALWFGGDYPGGTEALSKAAVLLSATRRLTVATGIASIWSRDAILATTAADTLADAWPDRFVLGLGVSHAPLVAARGRTYAKPLTAVREYLDAMDAAASYAAPLHAPVPRVLAALRPRMLELARDRAQGAHPYFTTPEHTAKARAVLGPDPLLAPEQAVVLTTDPAHARTRGREYTAIYLSLPNYVNNLRELGWSDADLTAENGTGSDALVDALVAWGDAAAVAERVNAHRAAGADHVSVQPLAPTVEEQTAQLRELAPLLRA
ncbi:TIGR03620 family F420-dependent LLM class oxidoreductase [Streptomonospora sp. S1-112]|uniref:TIGR03620 family F420-dependent LLM class oxidoreductase n=1 Tax=Streptomonospora mangrovi TaxID=2883123 RepID=A0A9X3SEZ0_9ACTN|nr:TIGR03620 family F420-dependent LLM class oxidoreductase [Streptomonospora mangrovi]MDA0566368.1 TIGR03620 family F420-dependent LLM class oxidoreductase [Streptomonospora mangrovi]